MIRKKLGDLSFDELVTMCSLTVLEALLKGSLHSGVRQACEHTAKWHELQSRKGNDDKAT